MHIEKILEKERIPDKPSFFATTSHQFKLDLWNFCQELGVSGKVFVELGTSRGYTAKLMSYLFKEVHTVNLTHQEPALSYLGEKNNIYLHAFDLYTFNTDEDFEKIPPGTVYLIDALHTKSAVFSDIRKCLEHKPQGQVKYFVFDDYGTYPQVKNAIDESIAKGVLEVVKPIGQPEGWSFGPPAQDNDRIMKDWEGIICKAK